MFSQTRVKFNITYGGDCVQTQLVCALERLLCAGRQSELRRLLPRTSLCLRQSHLEDWSVPLQEGIHVRLTSNIWQAATCSARNGGITI